MLDVVGTSAGTILVLDDTNNNVLVSVDGVIETRDHDFDLPDRVKKVSEVIPDLASQDLVCALMVQVGVRNRLSDDIRWSEPATFTIGVSEKIDFDFFRSQGKYIRLRFFTSQVDVAWSLSGYTIKYEIGGER